VVNKSILVELCEKMFNLRLTMIQATEVMIICFNEVRIEVKDPNNQKIISISTKKLFNDKKFASFLCEQIPFMHTVEDSRFKVQKPSFDCNAHMEQIY
jgi:hypothetical protein